MPARVLVVDDHLDLAETLADGLRDRGFDAVACASSEEAARLLEGAGFDALVTDLRMPRVDGLALLARSRKACPERPVVVMTAYGAIETAVEAIRLGAYQYLTKPFAADELALFLERALDDARVRREARTLRATLTERVGLGSLVAASPAMREVFDLAARVADAATPVLLLGETGTGKTALARAIHDVCADIATSSGVSAEMTLLVDQPPTAMNPPLGSSIEATIRRRGWSYRRMVSGAGHDSQILGRQIPTAMIFVPSRDGRSHSPAEFTSREQLMRGVQTLADTLLAITS